MKQLFDRRTGRRVPAWEYQPEITGRGLLGIFAWAVLGAALLWALLVRWMS
jgi:hypothetical protein